MQSIPSKSNTLIITFLGIYFIWLFINMGHIIPHFDTFYYWDWSRHLALSYFDGPPLVAYAFALYTRLFGDTLFAINFFSLTTTYLTGFVIYKTARLIMDKRASLLAMALWVVSPVVIQYLIRQATYDNVLNLFWALSLYFILKFTLDNKNKNLYWIGVSLGLTMLAKYSGIVLIFSLVLFSLIVPRFRKLYSNVHFYIAMLIIVLFFTPVIIWNVQHHWISITYQSSNHVANIAGFWGHILNMLKMVGGKMIPLYNFLIAVLVYGCFKSWGQIKRSESLQLLLVVSFTFILFYILVSFFIKIHSSWLVPSCISIIILSAYFLSHWEMRKSTFALLAVYFVLGIVVLLANGFLAKRVTLEGARYATIQAFNKKYGEHHPIIVTSSWMSARMVFFLAGHPPIYTLPCGGQNQYGDWSRQVLVNIESKKIKEVLYVDFDDQHQCVAKYFAQCKKLPVSTYQQHQLLTGETKRYHLNSYLCTNP